jgi:hypothetical protein
VSWHRWEHRRDYTVARDASLLLDGGHTEQPRAVPEPGVEPGRRDSISMSDIKKDKRAIMLQ